MLPVSDIERDAADAEFVSYEPESPTLYWLRLKSSKVELSKAFERCWKGSIMRANLIFSPAVQLGH
jgi:hypothetical protein